MNARCPCCGINYESLCDVVLNEDASANPTAARGLEHLISCLSEEHWCARWEPLYASRQDLAARAARRGVS